jgi:hypothetical protein
MWHCLPGRYWSWASIFLSPSMNHVCVC